MNRLLRSIGVSAASFFLVAGSAYAVTTISANVDTDGNIVVDGNATLGDAAADVLTLNGTVAGGSPLTFEGATTADGFQTIFAITDATVADKTITFPNANITVNAAADISGTTLAANVVTSSLTTVGTLGSLTVAGATALNGTVTICDDGDTVAIDSSDWNITAVGDMSGIGTIGTNGTLTFSGVTTDITAASGEDLVVMGGATSGSVIIQSNDDFTDFRQSNGTTVAGRVSTSGGAFQMRGNPAVGNAGIVEPGSAGNGYGVLVSNANDISATIPVLLVSDTRDTVNTKLFSVGGGGFYTVALHQDVTCAAGVLALDPTSSVIDLDPAGAACVVTLAETTAAGGFNVPGMEVTIHIVGSAGAGVVTFPDVTNIHNGPTLCTTTGLTEDGTYTIMYVDKTNDLWLGKSCIQN